MTKQEIVKKYEPLHNRDKKTITSMALDYLRKKEIEVWRTTLLYWRQTPGHKSKYSKDYQDAYQYAFEQFEQQPRAAQTA